MCHCDICLCLSDPISAVIVSTLPSTLPLSVCISYLSSATTLRAVERGLFLSAFLATVFRTAKSRLYVNLRGPDKARMEFWVRQRRKAHHSQQSAQHSHPSSQTKQQQSAAKQASRHPLSFFSLTITCWGGPWFKFVRLLRVSYKGRVPDLLILHSGGKRLVSFLGHIGGAGAFTKTYGGGPC